MNDPTKPTHPNRPWKEVSYFADNNPMPRIVPGR